MDNFLLAVARIEYRWFYSALTQSLAALIGIVGVFIVYRLQIQQNNINEAIRNLQLYLAKVCHLNLEALYYLTQEQTKEQAEARLKGAIAEKERYKSELEELRVNNQEELKVKRRIVTVSSRINILEDEEKEFDLRIRMVKEREDLRTKIKKTAFAIIIYFCILFLITITCLLLSKNFDIYWYWGFGSLVGTFILIIAGLCYLIKCCYISLDIRTQVRE